MNKVIIKSIVSIICAAAICVTIFLCSDNKEANYPDYMSETQAAEYLGIDEARLVIMRKNLKYLEGAYVAYSYEENGEMVTVYKYSKQALNDTMAELMATDSKRNINFKYIEEVLKDQEKAE